jgi:hypothetical protein
MNTPVQVVNDPVDALLKADAAASREGHIDDAGFTLRVMDQLPHRRGLPGWVRNGVPVSLAAAGAVFAFVFAGGDTFLVDASMDLATGSFTHTALGFCVLATLLIGAAVQLARER